MGCREVWCLCRGQIIDTLHPSLHRSGSYKQEIKKWKGHAGMVGLSRDKAALDRLVITTRHRPYCSSRESVPQWIPQSFQIFCEERTLSALRRNCFVVNSKCSEDSTDIRAALWRQTIRSKHTDKESGIISDRVRWGKARHSAIHTEGSELECPFQLDGEGESRLRVGEVIKLREERELLGKLGDFLSPKPEDQV